MKEPHRKLQCKRTEKMRLQIKTKSKSRVGEAYTGRRKGFTNGKEDAAWGR
jgi:hypothetical protein